VSSSDQLALPKNPVESIALKVQPMAIRNEVTPLLANVALHGLEYQIKQAFPVRKVTMGGKRHRIATPDVIRYCDDFVILHEDLTVVQKCQSLVCEWLKDMGLELKPSKTRISHTLNRYEDNDPGFEFLGFSVRQFPVGKYQSGKLNGVQ
jgi:RNA-directed DNA polymerase